MNIYYELSLFCSTHPKDFMPLLKQYRMTYHKDGAKWQKDGTVCSIEPTQGAYLSAKLNSGGEYLYRVRYQGPMQTLPFLLDQFFATTKAKVTACRGFLRMDEMTQAAWIRKLKKNARLRPQNIEGGFLVSDKGMTFLAHRNGDLELALRAEKGSHIPPLALLAMETVMNDVYELQEDLFSISGMRWEELA